MKGLQMDSRNLSVLAYSNGFTLWHYKTSEDAEALRAPGYFGDNANIFSDGDAVFITYCGEARYSELRQVEKDGDEVVLLDLD